MKKFYFILMLAFVLPIFSNGQSVYLYHPYKLLDNEEDYLVFEDTLDNGIAYNTFCENTGKLYLRCKNTIIEYDITAIKRKSNGKRQFNLTSDAESIIAVSPNGDYLAYVDKNHEKLHVVDIITGNEVKSAKLGKKFDNTYIDKDGKTDSYGCPFAFQSNNEILISGMATAMLFNIETGKSQTIPFPKPYNEYTKNYITFDGKISGSTANFKDKKYVTFKVAEGKITNTIPGMCLLYHDDNEYYKHVANASREHINRRTGELIDFRFRRCDNNHLYRLDLVKYHEENYWGIAALSRPGLSLAFPNSKKALWLTGDYGKEYFYVLGEKNIQIYNHSLTSNELEKAILKDCIDYHKDIYHYNNFIENYPKSKYIGIAQEKLAECIAEEWKQRKSMPSNFTVEHADDVQAFINEYNSHKYKDMKSAQLELTLNAAQKELDNIYKVRYERLKDNDIQSIEQYIKEFPKSPYLNQVKEKQKLVYKPGYDALCLNETVQPYWDYVSKYPNSPYVEEIKDRIIPEVYRREKEAKEAAALAEKQRQEAEKKRLEEERIAEQKRKEEEALAEQKRQEEERKKLIAVNSDVKNWYLGNKICKCDQKHIMVVLDSWNENKTAFKGQVLASDVFYYDDAQLLQRDKMIWFETNGWHKCLEDEIEYCRIHDRSHEISADGHIPPPASFTRLKKGDVVKYYHEWTENVGNWLFGYKDVTKSCLIFADVEDVNEDCSRIKVKITSVSNACGDSYYTGKTLWWDANDWKKVR